jgi:hypothetical protein
VPVIPDEPVDFRQTFGLITTELERRTCQVESIYVLLPGSWAEMRNRPDLFMLRAGTAEYLTFAGNIAATFTPQLFTERVRQHFHAIVRVRGSFRPVDRPVHRLGGTPNRGGVVGSAINPVRPAPGPTNPVLYRPPGLEDGQAAEVLHRLRDQNQTLPVVPQAFVKTPVTETPLPEIPVVRDSLWVQRASGEIVVVVDILRAQDGSDVISFHRSTAEETEPSVSMTRQDFLVHHRLYVSSSDKETQLAEIKKQLPKIAVSPNEEWGCTDGSGILVTEVDFRKEAVYGNDVRTGKRRQIPFSQFAMAGQWRKIVRRSIYERIRQPDFELTPDEDE